MASGMGSSTPSTPDMVSVMASINELSKAVIRNQEEIMRVRQEADRDMDFKLQKLAEELDGKLSVRPRSRTRSRHEEPRSENNYASNEEGSVRGRTPRQRRNNEERRQHRGRREEDDRVEERRREEKLKLPSFHGKADPELYLDWELKVEQIFTCHEVREDRKVKLASLEFKEHALLWFDQIQKERTKCGFRLVEEWEELKEVMRRRYVPSYYQRELHHKLQRITQGNKSVEEYYNALEVAKIRAEVDEKKELAISRFLNGLNYEIRDMVELHDHQDLQELVHQASKVEQQLKRKSAYKRNNSSNTSSNWKDKGKAKGEDNSKDKAAAKATPSKLSNLLLQTLGLVM